VQVAEFVQNKDEYHKSIKNLITETIDKHETTEHQVLVNPTASLMSSINDEFGTISMQTRTMDFAQAQEKRALKKYASSIGQVAARGGQNLMKATQP
jgi:trehalose-6-phosphate synthase|tara:strand:- start:157 stop:447 length:291 start_codon:yes stop_codon:yes gene_type:complete